MSEDTLVRLRADPEKVRVSIRRVEPRWWRVTIASRCGGGILSTGATEPREALARALRWANETRMDGIDLDMQRAYKHPQKVAR